MNDTPHEFDANEAALAGFGSVTGADRDHGRDELERLASALTDRVRAGESADVAELAVDGLQSLHQRLADLAPVVEALERWKSLKETDVDAGFPETFPLRRIGDCRLVREIGRGGNGIVFEAVQGVTWFRTVAVKVSPWRAVTANRLAARFLDEAATLSRLQHRHIVPIHSYSIDREYPYYVMRLAEGGSIDRIIARFQTRQHGPAEHGAPAAPAGLTRTSWRAFAEIGRQVASALDYAHSQGVIHGDIKPANVLLDAHGQVLVSDFGSAPPDDTDRGSLLTGTYRYMAPERFDGVCNERSDVYALGATLYELFVTAPAFDTDQPDMLISHIRRHDLIAPKLIRPDIPADLDAIVSKAMMRDPQQRYRSAGEMAIELLNYLNGKKMPPRSRRRFGWLPSWPFGRSGRQK